MSNEEEKIKGYVELGQKIGDLLDGQENVDVGVVLAMLLGSTAAQGGVTPSHLWLVIRHVVEASYKNTMLEMGKTPDPEADDENTTSVLEDRIVELVDGIDCGVVHDAMAAVFGRTLAQPEFDNPGGVMLEVTTIFLSKVHDAYLDEIALRKDLQAQPEPETHPTETETP